MERSTRVRKTTCGALFRSGIAFSIVHYKFVIKGLHRSDQFGFIVRMPSKITLTLGTALAGIALCCFVESSIAQDALVASLNSTENDENDAEDKTIETTNLHVDRNRAESLLVQTVDYS